MAVVKPQSDVSEPETKPPTDNEISRAKDAAHSAAKSFRVTLDDPCFKVLPAALKKYKINDDWKLYALFICYANTGEFGANVVRKKRAPLAVTGGRANLGEIVVVRVLISVREMSELR
jgi:hypothetical protein